MSSESTGTVTAVAFKKDKLQDSYAPSKETKALWDAVHDELRNEFGEAVFRSWLKPLTLQASYHGTLEVSVPTRFMRDWIQSHYSAKILEMCAARNPDVRRLEIVVVQSAMAVEQVAEDAQKQKSNQNVNLVSQELQEISSPFDPRFTFDTFVIGKPNALAHAAASRIIESANVPFNPLFIYGGVGLGKTHLMHAIGAAMKAKSPEKRVVYLSAEKFMYQFVKSLRAKDMMSFKEAFRSVDVLMMDYIQFISGKEQTQE